MNTFQLIKALEDFEIFKKEYARENSDVDIGELYNFAWIFADYSRMCLSVDNHWQDVQNIPMDGTRVLVSDEYGTQGIMWYNGLVWKNTGNFTLSRLTHWRHVPLPPVKLLPPTKGA